MKRTRRPIVDLDAIMHEIRERQERERSVEQAESLRSPLTEARLLAAIIAEPCVLELCEDVELDDFTDFRYRAAFKSIRDLQASGCRPDLLAIVDDIAMDDLAYDKHVGETVDVVFLASLVDEMPPYRRDLMGLEHDRYWLRTLADKRRAL